MTKNFENRIELLFQIEILLLYMKKLLKIPGFFFQNIPLPGKIATLLNLYLYQILHLTTYHPYKGSMSIS